MNKRKVMMGGKLVENTFIGKTAKEDEDEDEDDENQNQN